jgi:hypothetical protein
MNSVPTAPPPSDAATSTTSTTSTPTPADVVNAAAPRRGLPAAVQRMVDHIQMSRLMQAMRLQNRPAKPKPAAGLWPVDERGQYRSAKPTSKRNRAAQASRLMEVQ